jgi:hypothetical protein
MRYLIHAVILFIGIEIPLKTTGNSTTKRCSTVTCLIYIYIRRGEEDLIESGCFL